MWGRTVVVGCMICGAACGRYRFSPIAEDTATDASPEVDGVAAPCDLAAPFGAPVPVAELNTPLGEGSLRLLPDELAGYFHSGGNIYRAERSDLSSPFTVTPVTAVNSADFEQEPTASSDDLMLVFRRRVVDVSDLYYATRSASDLAFGSPVRVDALSTSGTDKQPFLAAADGHLYFTSIRDGDDEDVYRSERTGTAFGVATILEELRSANEGDAVLSFDGLDIYWGTNRTGGLGLVDVWTAHRATSGEPFSSHRVLPGVNSTRIEGPSWISPDSCRLYLASDRDGNFDIYVASRPG